MLFEHCNYFLDPIKTGGSLPALVNGDFAKIITIHELNYFLSNLLLVSSGRRYLCRSWKHHILPGYQSKGHHNPEHR
jgi:hypothetical protein